MMRAVLAACALGAMGLFLPALAQTKQGDKPKPAKEMYVTVKADLFEVDDADYQTLLKTRSSWKSVNDALEEFVNSPKGKVPPAPTLFDTLQKQKAILTGKPVDVDSGQEGELFAMTRMITLLPRPEDLRQGRGAPQTITEALLLLAHVAISPDRRSVRVKFTEHSRAIEGVTKHAVIVDKEGTLQEGQTAFIVEGSLSRTRDIPDGGTFLLALTHRPREARDKDRWLVARVTPRIYIEAEERAIRGEGGK